MTARNDNSGEARQIVSDSSAGNGAPGGHEAHGNFIDCVMKTVETSASSAVKDQAAGVGDGVRNQLNRIVGNPLEEQQKTAELKQPKDAGGDSADKAALGWTFSEDAKRAAGASQRQTLVFDNSIYPQPSDTAKQGADEWFDSAVNKKKAA